MGASRTLALVRGLVAIVATLMAGPGRRRWRREWDAEMVAWFESHKHRPGARWTLLRRALLAPVDALIFRRHFGRLRFESIGMSAKPQKELVMDSLFKDLKFAGRSCRKQPTLTAVLLLTIALGIGGTTAIFSLLHGIVLSPLPYPEEDRIVQIWPARSQGLSKALLLRLEEESKSYEAVAAISEGAFRRRAEDRSDMVYGSEVSADYFRVLGAQAALGSPFQEGDDRESQRYALLSHEFWQKHHGEDSDIVGKAIELDGESFLVRGVMEPGLSLPQRPFDVALTHQVIEGVEDFNANYMDFVGRLRPGVTVAEADAELRTLASRWALEEGVSQEWAETASVTTLREFLVGDLRRTLALLLGAVAFILLIVAANVANLLLARALAREQEISVRTALGATSLRLVRQLLTETLALAMAGGLLGMALTMGLLRTLKAFLPADVPRLESIELAPQVLVFAFAAAAVTGLLVGLVPAVSTARSQLRSGLGSAGRYSGSRSRHRLRSGLVVAEVTLAIVLLAGAGVLIKSFWRTLQVNPGFEPSGLVEFSVLPGATSWESPEQLETYFQRLRERLRTVPGVSEVATVHAPPIVNGGWVMGTFPADDPPPEGELPPYARWRPVSPEYFRTARIELLAGRQFTEQDLTTSEPVAILNETTAKAFFGGADQAIGRDIHIGFDRVPRQRVVGVVEDVRILGLREEAPLAAYRPYTQGSIALHRIEVHSRHIIARLELPQEAVTGPLRAAVEDHDPFANVLRLKSMDDAIATSLARPRVVMWLLAAFATVALLLGALGIYGVMGFTVTERRREMGIRLALGAPVSSVLRRTMANGLRLIAGGILLGLGLALVLTRLLASQLFEVSPTDPAVLLLAGGTLLAAALLAVYLPARRAGQMDPVEVLRAE